jgi:TRAP-type C4-dicarboxylate transport system permease small subunit
MVDWFAKRSESLSSLALVILVGLVVVDVVGRLMSSPLPSGPDIATLLLVALVFLPMAGTQIDGNHVSMDVLVSMLPPWLQNFLHKINLLICAIIGAFLAYGTTKTAIKSYALGEFALGGLQIPLWIGKAMLAFGLTFYTLVVIAQLFGGPGNTGEPDRHSVMGVD